MASSSSPSTAADFSAARRAIDAALLETCDRLLGPVAPPVAEAIRYSLTGEGKRLRGILLSAAYRAAGGAGDPGALAAAVEIVHTSSLVHDDLPCMDDDDVRRGRPTTHRAFGVSTATVAGLVMVPLAARALHDGCAALGLPSERTGRILREILAGAGAGGMIGGQLLDLEGEGRSLEIEQLERIHRAKTGALIAASVRAGGIAAGADDRALEALGRYGAAIGLAFQVVDDLLDVTATAEQLGKAAAKDAVLGKGTYPGLLGIPATRRLALRLADEACEALAAGGVSSHELDALARYCVERDR